MGAAKHYNLGLKIYLSIKTKCVCMSNLTCSLWSTTGDQTLNCTSLEKRIQQKSLQWEKKNHVHFGGWGYTLVGGNTIPKVVPYGNHCIHVIEIPYESVFLWNIHIFLVAAAHWLSKLVCLIWLVRQIPTVCFQPFLSTRNYRGPLFKVRSWTRAPDPRHVAQYSVGWLSDRRIDCALNEWMI